MYNREVHDIKREASIQSVSLGYDGSKFKETFIEGFIACSNYLKNKEIMYNREEVEKLLSNYTIKLSEYIYKEGGQISNFDSEEWINEHLK